MHTVVATEKAGIRLPPGPSRKGSPTASPDIGRSAAAPDASAVDVASGTREGRMIEHVDHPHEHLVTPADASGGARRASLPPGAAIETLAGSRVADIGKGAVAHV